MFRRLLSWLLFWLLIQNTWHSQVKGGKVYLDSQFIEVSVNSYLAPRQSSTAERHHRGESVHGMASRRQQSSNRPAFLSLLIFHSGYNNIFGAPAPIIHTQTQWALFCLHVSKRKDICLFRLRNNTKPYRKRSFLKIFT